MIPLADRPRFDAGAARALARHAYQVDGTVAPLPSERDQNFLLTSSTGERFVLKISNASEDAAQLEAQTLAMERLAAAGLPCPAVRLTSDGSRTGIVAGPDGRQHLVRLVTCLPGVPLARRRRPPSALFRDIGRCLGQIDRALSGFDHPGAHRAFHWDLARGVAHARERLVLVEDASLRERVRDVLETIEARLRPLAARLPRGVIHNDANDFNILVAETGVLDERTPAITGIIDFGDMIHTWIAAEPATALAYALLDKPDPLPVAAQLVSGYHAERPLTDDELAAVFPLALLRLCLSVCIGAEQCRLQPRRRVPWRSARRPFAARCRAWPASRPASSRRCSATRAGWSPRRPAGASSTGCSPGSRVSRPCSRRTCSRSRARCWTSASPAPWSA